MKYLYLEETLGTLDPSQPCFGPCLAFPKEERPTSPLVPTWLRRRISRRTSGRRNNQPFSDHKHQLGYILPVPAFSILGTLSIHCKPKTACVNYITSLPSGPHCCSGACRCLWPMPTSIHPTLTAQRRFHMLTYPSTNIEIKDISPSCQDGGTASSRKSGAFHRWIAI